jgi:hypothetical protein
MIYYSFLETAFRHIVSVFLTGSYRRAFQEQKWSQFLSVRRCVCALTHLSSHTNDVLLGSNFILLLNSDTQNILLLFWSRKTFIFSTEIKKENRYLLFLCCPQRSLPTLGSSDLNWENSNFNRKNVQNANLFCGFPVLHRDIEERAKIIVKYGGNTVLILLATPVSYGIYRFTNDVLITKWLWYNWADRQIRQSHYAFMLYIMCTDGRCGSLN